MIINAISGGNMLGVQKRLDGTTLKNGTKLMNFNNITQFDNGVLLYAYCRNTSLTTRDVVMSNLTTVGDESLAHTFESSNVTSFTANNLTNISSFGGFYYAFNYSDLEEVNMTGLVNVSGTYAFSNAFANSKIVTFNTPNLGEVSGESSFSNAFSSSKMANLVFPARILSGNNCCVNMCGSCNSLISAVFPNLSTISGAYAMNDTFAKSSVQKVEFYELTNITSAAFNMTFSDCLSLQEVIFYRLNNVTESGCFGNMLSSTTNATVHFPVSLQATIGGWSDVQNGFGGTNASVLFDIAAQIDCANGVSYTRHQADSTASYTAFCDPDNVLYYTAGNTEPQVGDNVYSDTALTTVVTTIDVIR